MRLATVGPATKKLVKEVKQVATQSIAEVAMIEVELGDLRSNIAMPTE